MHLRNSCGLAIEVVCDFRLFLVLVQLDELLDVLIRIDLLRLLNCNFFLGTPLSVGLDDDLQTFLLFLHALLLDFQTFL